MSKLHLEEALAHIEQAKEALPGKLAAATQQYFAQAAKKQASAAQIDNAFSTDSTTANHNDMTTNTPQVTIVSAEWPKVIIITPYAEQTAELTEMQQAMIEEQFNKAWNL